VNGQQPPKGHRDPKRAWLVGLCGGVLAAAMLVAAWIAEQHPAAGMALLLPTAAGFFWYRVRYTD
jgi:hypothetical protein